MARDYVQSVEVFIVRESGKTTRYTAAAFPSVEVEEVRTTHQGAVAYDAEDSQARLSLVVKTTQGARNLVVTES
jgi:hypothetical protein